MLGSDTHRRGPLPVWPLRGRSTARANVAKIPHRLDSQPCPRYCQVCREGGPPPERELATHMLLVIDHLPLPPAAASWLRDLRLELQALEPRGSGGRKRLQAAFRHRDTQDAAKVSQARLECHGNSAQKRLLSQPPVVDRTDGTTAQQGRIHHPSIGGEGIPTQPMKDYEQQLIRWTQPPCRHAEKLNLLGGRPELIVGTGLAGSVQNMPVEIQLAIESITEPVAWHESWGI